MSILVKALPAPKPRTKESVKIALLFAGILVVMAVAQLFTFEEFLPLVERFNLPLSPELIYAVGPLIVVSEVFALPFLLRMRLSTAFRYLSMFLSWLAASLWLYISLWLAISYVPVETVGFLGTVINFMPGWSSVFISVALVILTIWSSWGLWPGKTSKK